MSVLRRVFGPCKEEIWKQIASDIGGDYKLLNFWGKDCLIYQSGEWEIVLDTYTMRSTKHSKTYTRMRAPFVNKDGFYFKVYRKDFFSSIGKLFGMQDILVGDRFFDEHFIIQGNNVEKVMLLFDDPEIKRLVSLIPDVCFEIKDDEGFFIGSFPEGVDELYFRTYGVITDINILKDLFDLFAITLDRLVQIDSAYEDDPNFKLY